MPGSAGLARGMTEVIEREMDRLGDAFIQVAEAQKAQKQGLRMDTHFLDETTHVTAELRESQHQNKICRKVTDGLGSTYDTPNWPKCCLL